MLKIVLLTFFSITVTAQDYSVTVYKDNFSGAQLNKRWLFYKSISEQKDGSFVCRMAADSDHASFNYLNIEPIKDFEVSLRFKFNGAKFFNIGFMDRQYKKAHAGHICNVFFTKKFVQLREGKTGVFDLKVREMMKKGKLDAKTKSLLKTKEKNFYRDFKEGTWYKVTIKSAGTLMTLSVDGKKIGSLTSAGIAHTTKRRIGLSVQGDSVYVDDFQLKSKSK